MAANVETMFSVRETPWHGLGTIVSEAPTSLDALHLAGLDWNVIQEPIFDVRGKKIEGHVANVRSSDSSVLGVVTPKYKVVQNSEAFDFTDSLISDEVRYETAGSLRNGRTIWLLAKMPEVKILDDSIEPYICFTNSHDGKGAIKVCMTPVRVVCNNTLNLALSTAKRSWTTVHMGDMASKLEEAKITLGLAEAYMEGLNNEAEILVNETIATPQVQNLICQLLPIEDDAQDRTKKTIDLKRQQLLACMQAPDIKKFQNTKWGFIQGVSDFVGHAEPARLTKSYKENNWNRIMNGHNLLDSAYELIKAI